MTLKIHEVRYFVFYGNCAAHFLSARDAEHWQLYLAV